MLGPMRLARARWGAVILLALAEACSDHKVDSSRGSSSSPPPASSSLPPNASSSLPPDPSSVPSSVSSPSPPSQEPYAYFYGNDVYGGHVYAVPRGGGTAVVLAAGDTTHTVVGKPVAFDATNVYFSSGVGSPPGTLMAVPRQGGVPVAIASTSGRIVGIAVDTTSVYLLVRQALARPQSPPVDASAAVAGTQSSVQRVAKAGGSLLELASIALSPQAIAVDKNYVYWTEYGAGPDGSVSRVPLGGGGVEVLAQGQAMPNAVAVDPSGVYWVDWGTRWVDCTSKDGSLMQLTPGSRSPVAIASGLDGPLSLAVANGDLYLSTAGFTCNGPTDDHAGGLFKWAQGSASAVSLATAVTRPENLFIDSTDLYFTQVVDSLNQLLAPQVVGK
jgi:hypothetical protein